MSRFDYVKYDEQAMEEQAVAKTMVSSVEAFINGIQSPRAKAIAQTKLEEVYMWIGKGIRDDQIVRAKIASLQVPLQEGRKDG